MLVLSRQRDETIMIGDDVEITVVDIRGDKVRIGINAPTRIAVHRKEVYDAIKAENLRAATISDSDMDIVSREVTPSDGPRPGRSAPAQSPQRRPTGGSPSKKRSNYLDWPVRTRSCSRLILWPVLGWPSRCPCARLRANTGQSQATQQTCRNIVTV